MITAPLNLREYVSILLYMLLYTLFCLNIFYMIEVTGPNSKTYFGLSLFCLITKEKLANDQTVLPFQYFVKSTGTNLATAKSLIQAAIKEIQESSCVEWVPRKDERFYVKFEGKEYEG